MYHTDISIILTLLSFYFWSFLSFQLSFLYDHSNTLSLSWLGFVAILTFSILFLSCDLPLLSSNTNAWDPEVEVDDSKDFFLNFSNKSDVIIDSCAIL